MGRQIGKNVSFTDYYRSANLNSSLQHFFVESVRVRHKNEQTYEQTTQLKNGQMDGQTNGNDNI